MAQPQRIQRVADLLQRELAIILQHELTDPRLGFLTITGVDMSRDLANAKVYVSSLTLQQQSTDISPQQQIEILQHSVRFIRGLLGQRVQLRYVPQLRFVYDDSTIRANHISELIERAVATDDTSSQ